MITPDPDHLRRLIRICERHRDRVRGERKRWEEDIIAQLKAELEQIESLQNQTTCNSQPQT